MTAKPNSNAVRGMVFSCTPYLAVGIIILLIVGLT